MNKGMIIRLLVLLFALANQSLVMFGFSPLPWGGEVVGEFITILFTVGSSLLVWWKDNPVTKKAKTSNEVLVALKQNKISEGDVNKVISFIGTLSGKNSKENSL